MSETESPPLTSEEFAQSTQDILSGATGNWSSLATTTSLLAAFTVNAHVGDEPISGGVSIAAMLCKIAIIPFGADPGVFRQKSAKRNSTWPRVLVRLFQAQGLAGAGLLVYASAKLGDYQAVVNVLAGAASVFDAHRAGQLNAQYNELASNWNAQTPDSTQHVPLQNLGLSFD